MILSISSDKPSFRTVHFKPGLNVVLADKPNESTNSDTLNGLGKSALIEIIHFCLGSGSDKSQPLFHESLKDWTFSLELKLPTGVVIVSRNTSNPQKVVIEGTTEEWHFQPEDSNSANGGELRIGSWTQVLGTLMFGLPVEKPNKKYFHTFRSLISYFVRRGGDAYLVPFEYNNRQSPLDVQINNTYLLSLNWEYASELQSLKDQKKHLNNLNKGHKEGILTQYLGSTGEIKAELVRLKSQIKDNDEGLSNFIVLPQYRQLEEKANRQTREIQRLRDDRQGLELRLSYYKSSLVEEKDTDQVDVEEIYREAGVGFPDSIKQQLKNVEKFHSQVLANRKEYLNGEIVHLKAEISKLSAEIDRITRERGKIMSTLTAHGPWDEYQKLTEQQSTLKAECQKLEISIKTLREIEDGTSFYKINRETLIQKMRQDYDERHVQRDRAIKLFSDNSKALYDAPGRLVVNVTENGYKFDVDIQRSGSSGIDSMKVFCYDLALAELWCAKNPNPGFLVHDSIIFDGVDERQIALGLQLAAQKAEKLGFQYICSLNSDMVPYRKFSNNGFDFESYVRLKLTDTTPEGGLLGIRY